MADLDDIIGGLTQGNIDNSTAMVNDSERDGNVTDLLFSTDQAALTVNTNVSPQSLTQNLANGTLTQKNWIVIALIGLVAWWLLKK